MHIGIDLDNTIICYDHVFHACAAEQNLIPPDTPRTKRAVRDAIRHRPEGELEWATLQGRVYGIRIVDAVPYDGVLVFLHTCRTQGVPVTIVSHKHQFPARGPQVNLRQAALQWLERYGLRLERICFEDSLAAKADRITALACSHFIDDLPEFLATAHLPEGLQRLLFAPAPPRAHPGMRIFSSWHAILREFAKEMQWTLPVVPPS